MSRVIAGGSVYSGGMPGFLPLGLFTTGLLIGTMLALHGLGRLLRDPAHRFLAITTLGVVVLFMVTGGRVYHFAGVMPLLWAASAAGIEQRRPAIWWRWVATWPVFLLTVLAMGVADTLPIKPVSALADRPVQIGNFQLDEIGWPQMVDDVTRALPPGGVVVTASYRTVSAMQHYARPGCPSTARRAVRPGSALHRRVPGPCSTSATRRRWRPRSTTSHRPARWTTTCGSTP